MGPYTHLLLFIPVACALAFVFGRNAYKGVRTGAMWAKSRRYLRDEDPILFWIAVGFSITFAAGSVAGIAIALWAVATLR